MPSSNIFSQDTFVIDINGDSSENISTGLDDLANKISRFQGKKTIVFANASDSAALTIPNGTLGPYDVNLYLVESGLLEEELEEYNEY